MSSGEDKNQELQAGYHDAEFASVKGNREVILYTMQKETFGDGQQSNVVIPALSENVVIVPNTIELEFTFKSKNNKSWFLNNLGRLLVKDLTIMTGGTKIYENTGESIFGTYCDLWKSEEERKDMLKYGVASENA